MIKKHQDVLSLLRIIPSPQSVDYVRNKKQFQLHTLLTEQRHPLTWNLSFAIKEDIQEGLAQIFSVDEDIARKLRSMAEDNSLIQAAQAVCRAIREKRKIFVYGCGSTGRLAKQMESALWRPFWRELRKSVFWDQLSFYLSKNIEEYLIGEMTGGDRALISALEGFEDLQLVGKLQLQDRGIQKGDVVFCITEGGETSSVIGAMMAAAEQYEPLTPEEIDAAKTHLYFICNNPEEVLRPFDRSRAVLDHPAITKIFLTTGPQAITGSTRMQATTSETYFMGTVLETGIYLALREKLACRKSERLGFPHSLNPKGRLTSFESLRQALLASWGDLAKFTVLESETYRRKCRATYFAKKALVAVFVDCAERSPTFHLLPLDTVLERDRKCWVQVWTEAKDGTHAWTTFLGRKFRGLDESFYKSHFLEEISDAYLRAAALKSLAKAGNDQEKLYDFSFSRKNILARGPHKGDLGVAVCVDEEIDTLEDPRSSFHRFLKLFKKNGANLALVLVSDYDKAKVKKIIARLPLDPDRDVAMNICLDHGPDPLKMLRQTALKVLLNAHSTAVMARLGKVVGNTMTSVNPSNLKLIGRATYLIMNHVNDVSSGEDWRRRYGTTMPITYAQANAVLFEAREFSAQQSGETSEVELAIIRILEALRRKKNVTWKAALSIAETAGLERYLEEYNPSLRRQL